MSSLYVLKMKIMCISSQLCPALVTINDKTIAKPWNVLTGLSSIFKGIFFTKDMKSIMMAWDFGEISDPFHLLVGTTSEA